MRKYYRTSLAMTELNDVLLQQFDEEILQEAKIDNVSPINERFQLVNQYLDIIDDNTFIKTPSAMLEAFALLQTHTHIKGVRARTIKALRDHRHLIGNKFRRDPTNNQLFMQIISSPHFVVRELERMMRFGILGKYIPVFGNIIGQMQHDLFHLYTVDTHTFQCIRLLRQISNGSVKTQFPLASNIIHKQPKKEILYIAALLHDLGKGIAGNHSETGALLAESFCIQHSVSAQDTRLICWLIRNHLLLSDTQQREDLTDPEILEQLANKVKDQKNLDHLYLLTVADVYSTNPKLWTSWRAEKFRELYRQTQRLLRRGLGNPIDKDAWIIQNQAIAVNQLKELGYSEDDVFNLWGSPGDDYFLREAPKDIVWHTLAIDEHGDDPAPLVLIKETSEIKFEGATQIFICTNDQPQLFAAVTAAMDQLNLSIQDARIMTSNNQYSLDTFFVLEENGESIGDNPIRIKKIQQHLFKALCTPDEFPELIQRRTPRAQKHFAQSTIVTISNDLHHQRTILEVVTPDRPGLLARIGAIFARHNVVLKNARILTLGERVEDIFFIANEDDTPISDPELCITLQQDLCTELDEQAKAQANI
jgi:[protein-PII] uridylyltransferase